MPKPRENAAPDPVRTNTRFKRALFFAITVSIPIVLFICLEGALRLLKYDSGLDLVIQKEFGGKTVYAINRSVAKRYFAYAGTVIPEPADDTFAVTKPKNTRRIFCLGESTMAGFPYEFNATAPSFLRDRLRTEFPKYSFEVINVGLSAVSSFVVADFVNDLVNYEPDLFIIYLGHNEFYGVYGSGSSIQIPGGYWITRLTISLLRFKTFLLIRDSFAWVKQQLFKEPTKTKGTLMEQMVGDQYIWYGSPAYEQTRVNYERNLKEIIDAANARGIPVIFSSLVSNLRDAAPFHGMFTPSIGTASKERWKEQLAYGDSLATRKDPAGAVQYYKNCAKIDTMNALAFYKLGRVQYELGDYTDALRSFTTAKDLDGLRFRASEDFERTLESVCEERGAILAPVDSAFVANCDYGIVGSRLILEHLHPNIEGYFLMGKVFAQTIRQHHLLFTPSVWDSAKVQSDEECRSISGVTDFDYSTGNIKVAYLIHQWPFAISDKAYSYVPRNEVEKITLDYVQEKTIWSTARYSLAQYQANEGHFSDARAECYAVAKVIPFAYQPLLRIADYYQMEGKRDSAKTAYVRCYDTEDNPYARTKLAIILLEEEHAVEASKQIETAISLSPRIGFVLTSKEQALMYYLLGIASAKLAKYDLAREYATHALTLDPTFAEARSLVDQLNSLRKQ